VKKVLTIFRDGQLFKKTHLNVWKCRRDTCFDAHFFVYIT